VALTWPASCGPAQRYPRNLSAVNTLDYDEGVPQRCRGYVPRQFVGNFAGVLLRFHNPRKILSLIITQLTLTVLQVEKEPRHRDTPP
jgi:hypothetical protein